MADLTFESPVTKTYADVTSGVTLRDLSSARKILIRADDETAAAKQLGVAFGTSRKTGEALICGQRPTEWLVIGDAAAASAVIDTLDRTGHVSVIDHTHARCLFRLTGTKASSLLEKICSIDWSDTMTPDGAVVSASMAKVTCDIVRNDVDDAPSYLIACDRSFGQYLFDAIIDAGAEFDVGVSG